MWQRFTENARRVILLAQEEAGRTHSMHVDTEHLLLGALLVDEEHITQLFHTLGIEAQSVRLEAMRAIAEYPKGEQGVEPRLTSFAKRVLELACDEAGRHRHSAIEVDHLLIGLVREERSMASRILRDKGAELEKLRAIVGKAMGQDIASRGWRRTLVVGSSGTTRRFMGRDYRVRCFGPQESATRFVVTPRQL
jgi:ATP-dependent Clp protease ATP-binding subunit ClpC